MSSINRAKIIIDPAGKAGLYQVAPMPGWEVLGTVKVGDDGGALVRNTSTGIYSMANAGAIRSLDQRKVRAALGVDDRGRPSEMEGGKRRNVYIDEASWAMAVKAGDGNASEGIRRALERMPK